MINTVYKRPICSICIRVSTSLYFQKKGERKRLSKLESLDVIGYFSGFSIGTSFETSLGDAVSAFGFFLQEKSRARMTWSGAPTIKMNHNCSVWGLKKAKWKQKQRRRLHKKQLTTTKVATLL